MKGVKKELLEKYLEQSGEELKYIFFKDSNFICKILEYFEIRCLICKNCIFIGLFIVRYDVKNILLKYLFTQGEDIWKKYVTDILNLKEIQIEFAIEDGDVETEEFYCDLCKEDHIEYDLKVHVEKIYFINKKLRVNYI